ncbi:MAG: hypothetical protein VR65_09530 [Desulfobulbaceae bacterium BRH_c16a]|nr:MAG: hypothetical protein VR65_09530 [Desulfobulbaceae bacterium BRH_c16a]
MKFRGNRKQVLALNTFVKLVRCTNTVSYHVHKHLQNELTVSQFGILEALVHLGPMSQKELSEKILKSPGNITTIINNLEKAGLVTRILSMEDRRYYAIHLTEKGRELIERIFPVHAEILFNRMSVLTEQEQQTLGKLLKKLSIPEENDTGKGK